MNTKLKNLICIWVSILIILGTISGSDFISYAGGQDYTLKNVKISENGIMTWDAYPGAKYYLIRIGPAGGYYEDTSVDLKAICDKYKFDSKTYNVSIEAYTNLIYNGGVRLTYTYSLTYTYTSSRNKLGPITNVKWDDTIVSWNPVTNAETYVVLVAKNAQDSEISYFYTQQCSVDISKALEKSSYAYEYIIKIYAKAEEYISSDEYSETRKIEYHDYEITFDPNGGTVEPASMKTDGAVSLDSYPDPTREDYIFEGWFTDATGGTKVDITTKYSGDTTVYAHWTKDFTYRSVKMVNADADRFAAAKDMVFTIRAYKKPDDKILFLPKENYEFDHWEITEGNGVIEDIHNPVTKFTMGNEAVKISAKYKYVGPEIKELSVYVVEPEAGEHPTDAYTYSTDYSIINTIWTDVENNVELKKDDVFTEGKEYKVVIYVSNSNSEERIPFSDDATLFINDSSEGVTYGTHFIYGTTAIKTFTAKATPEYTVAFDTDGGSAISSVTVKKGKNVKMPQEDPVKEGYTFDGWYLDKGKTEKYDFEDPVYTDVTIYAKWNQAQDVNTTQEQNTTENQTEKPTESATTSPDKDTTDKPGLVAGVGRFSADGKTLTDESGVKYKVAEKVKKSELKKNTKIADKKSGGKYKITKLEKNKKTGKITGGTVEYVAPYDKNTKLISATENVKLAGVKFKVTSIAPNCAKGCKKLTKVVIGKNVNVIGKNAFNGCTMLKTITIKSTSLKKVGAGAFKGINKKATISVPKAKKKAYVKLLKNKGQAKTVKIK